MNIYPLSSNGTPDGANLPAILRGASMSNTIRYASVCSGVEAASLAWEKLGWKPVWFSEVEPFPCKVLAERFGASSPVNPLDPDEATDEQEREIRENWLKIIKREKMPDVSKAKVPNLGDMSKINGKEYHGAVDLLVGGTPCQDVSVAGKRKGFAGERSGLAFSYIRLLETMRPRWFVWENVPGVFSTNGGEDFKTLIEKFQECGYSVAWRVLDAQYVRVDGYPRAVPQRRRRVFVVGHLGEWQYPASVLFEPDCLFGDTPPRRIKGKGFAAGFAGGPGTASGIDGYNGTVTGNISTTVDGHCKLPNGSNLVGRLWDASGVNPTLNQCNAGSGIIGASNAKFWNGEDVSTTLTEAFADDRMPDKGKLPCVITETGRGFYSESAVGQTLKAHENQHRRNIICRATQQGNAETMTDCCPTITEAAGTSGNNQPIICAGFCQGASPAAGSIGYHEQVSPTIKAGESGTAQVPALLCVHGSQDPIVQTDHANAVNRNNGLENCVCYENHAQDSRIKTLDGVCSQICAKAGMGGENLPLVQHILYDNQTRAREPKSCGDVSCCLQAAIGMAGNNLPLVQEVFSVDALSSNSMKSVAIAENVIGRKVENGGNGLGAQEELVYTQNTTGVMGIANNATVRRLLPIECERLMGFPDNWTRIPWKGKPESECPDSPRYKACGNSMCVNVMRWIGMRIELVERKMNK